MEAGDRLRQRARRGFKGYPIATVAFYGPDDRRATKAVVSIIRQMDTYFGKLERWFSGTCPRCFFWANRDRWTGEMLSY